MGTLFYLAAAAWLMGAGLVYAEDWGGKAGRFAMLGAGFVPAALIGIWVSNEPSGHYGFLAEFRNGGSGWLGLLAFGIGAALSFVLLVPVTPRPGDAMKAGVARGVWDSAATDVYSNAKTGSLVGGGATLGATLATIAGISLNAATESIELGILIAIGVFMLALGGSFKVFRVLAFRAFRSNPDQSRHLAARIKVSSKGGDRTDEVPSDGDDVAEKLLQLTRTIDSPNKCEACWTARHKEIQLVEEEMAGVLWLKCPVCGWSKPAP